MKRGYPYRESDVNAAALRILARMAEDNGGTPPDTFRDAWKLANRLDGLSCKGVRRPRPGFTAELVPDPYGEWTVYYNARHGEAQRLRYLVHEIAEWYAVTGEPDLASLFDGLPGSRTRHYDGGDDPEDVRHRIARRVEQLCFRRP